MKIFLDANIIIDFLDKDRPLHSEAVDVFTCILEGDMVAGTSEDILTTVYYVCKKTIARKKLLRFFLVLQKNISLHAFGESVLKSAVAYCEKDHGADFEDVLQLFCARACGYTTVITNDKNFPTVRGVTIFNAESFLHHAHFESE